MMQLLQGTLDDLEIIFDELVSAFNEAEENKRAMMTLQSHVGSNFHKRVERVYADILRLTTEGHK